MRAVGITRFGGPEVLEIVELPVPEPGPGPGADPGGGSDREPADTVLRSGRHGPPADGIGPAVCAGNGAGWHHRRRRPWVRLAGGGAGRSP